MNEHGRLTGDSAPSRLQDTAPGTASESPSDRGPAAANAKATGEGSGTDAPAEDLPFQRLGQFRILARIGRGGMGDVYQGYDDSLHRRVAIKVLPQELAQDEELVRRFHAEATSAAGITHPNVVPVHWIGEDAGRHFFAMQYVEGESLSQLLERRVRLPVEEAADIVAQCLAGLRAAHARGLVHRDVKPGNVLLEQRTGRAILVDFGLVRRLDTTTQLTVPGMVMGTADYMAPEQGCGQPVDGRADIYSLGVVFYQLLSGRLPFQAETAAIMVFQHAYEPPFPLELAAPDVPERIRMIAARMMAKKPAERYQGCQEVLEALNAWRASHVATRKERTTRRRWLVAGAAAGGALFVAGGALTFIGGDRLARLWAGLRSSRKVRDGSRGSGPSALTEAELQGKVLTNSIGLKMVLIPAGQFTMGTDKAAWEAIAASSEGRAAFKEAPVPNESPAHEVFITKGFRLGMYEVTQAQYREIMAANPSRCSAGLREILAGKTKTDQHPLDPESYGDFGSFPVDSVTYQDAVEFCRRLSKRQEEQTWGRQYRLPTEAEWEYACRAGTTTAFSCGDAANSGAFNFGNTGGVKVGGSFAANAFDVYDMHGNVWEWVSDAYDPKFYDAVRASDPRCTQGETGILMRGGSFADAAIVCRSASRGVRRGALGGVNAWSGFPVGFRVACDVR